MIKRIAVVTTSRADFSYVEPIVAAIKANKKLHLDLVVSGNHFDKRFGYTYRDIIKRGITIDHRLVVTSDVSSPNDISQLLGRYVTKAGQLWARIKPDMIILFGDRSEVLAFALSALPYTIPLAHIGGGDFTFGAIDEQVRHALTKLSHLHFVSTPVAKGVLEQMGEEPWRIKHSGSLVIDAISHVRCLTKEELAKQIPLLKDKPYVLVTLHPETLSVIPPGEQIRILLAALSCLPFGIVFTYPNMDLNHGAIIKAVHQFVDKHPTSSIVIQNAGGELYYSLVKHATALVGNSSSLIYDTPFFMKPAVNIGNRQLGRVKPGNVLDVPFNAAKIAQAIMRVSQPAFMKSLDPKIKNFFGQGNAAAKIVATIASTDQEKLMVKKFQVKG